MTCPIPEFAPVTSAVGLLSILMTRPNRNSWYLFCFPTLQAVKGSIQDFLILPALLSQSREFCFPTYGCGKHVDLARICKLIGNDFVLDYISVAAQLQVNRTFDVQPIVGPQHASFANELDGRPVFRTHGDQDCTQDPAAELK